MYYHKALRIGFGNDFGPYKKNIPFKVFFQKPERKPESFKSECILAAQEIGAKHQADKRPLYVALSGGLDSQMVALAFKEAGVKFECVAMEFANRLNVHEVVTAKRFCEIHSIKLTTRPLDLEKFYAENLHLEVSARYSCRSPQHCVHLYFMESFLECTLVFSGSIVRLRPLAHLKDAADLAGSFRIQDHFKQMEMLTEKEFCRDLTFENSPVHSNVVTNFFQYSPELVAAGMVATNPLDMQFYSDRACGDIKRRQPQLNDFFLRRALLASEKYFLAKDGGFDVMSVARKYTGFELLHRKLGPQDQASQDREQGGLCVFNDKYRKPLESRFPVPSYGVVEFDQYYHNLIEHKSKDWLKFNLYNRHELISLAGGII